MALAGGPRSSSGVAVALAGSIAKRPQRNRRSSALSDFVRGSTARYFAPIGIDPHRSDYVNSGAPMPAAGDRVPGLDAPRQKGGRGPQQPEGRSRKHKARRRGPRRAQSVVWYLVRSYHEQYKRQSPSNKRRRHFRRFMAKDVAAPASPVSNTGDSGLDCRYDDAAADGAPADHCSRKKPPPWVA